MRCIVSMLLVVSFFSCANSTENRFVIKSKSMLGFMDVTGKVTISPQYKFSSGFSEGLAAVRSKEGTGYIDTTGKLVIPYQWDLAGVFSNSRAPVLEKGKYGFIDTQGKVMVEPKYDGFSPFIDGFAVVMKKVLKGSSTEELFGIINTDGLETTEFKYKFLKLGSHGLSLAVTEQKAFFIDHKGAPINSETYIFAFPYSERMALVSMAQGDLRYIDESGKTFIDLMKIKGIAKGSYVKLALSFSESLAVVGISDADGGVKYGAIDTSGQWRITPKFEGLGSFKEGLAPVLEKGQFGFINTAGELVIPNVYEEVESFKDTLALVMFKGKALYIDHKGNVVSPVEME